MSLLDFFQKIAMRHTMKQFADFLEDTEESARTRWTTKYHNMSSEDLRRQIQAIGELSESEQNLDCAYYSFISPAEQASMMKEVLRERGEEI